MKKFYSFGKVALVGALLAVSNNACTDLTETLYDKVEEKNFYKTDEEFTAALGAAYTSLYSFMNHGTIFSINEVSTDEMIIPHRGNDWYDGGQWLRNHRHEFGKTDDPYNNAWGFCYGGISNCNRLLEQLAAADPVKAANYTSELKTLRALFYYWLLDMYGNVPVVTGFKNAETAPATQARAAVYAFVEGELTANVPKLTKIVDKSTYARVNYYVGEAILAKLYLNSGIYLGTGAPTAANLDKSLAASNEIINSAKYGLESDYASNFKFNNETSKENIFVIPYDQVNAQGFNLVQMTLHYLSQKTFNLDSQPWNGYCSLSEFYNSYEDKDSRKKSSFLVGPQFASDGITRLIDDQAEPNDPDGKPLTFTPEVNALEPNCLRQAGARVFKYQFQNGATPNMNNDMPLFRYADILLVKAEALWRKNAADLDALALVNVVRARANASPYLITDMTATKLLAERGREMFAEAVRRQDMIRFDAYAKPFQFKTTTDLACKNVFPIPQKQIDANTKLVQNDCYK